MHVCKTCGYQIEIKGIKFCPQCGAEVTEQNSDGFMKDIIPEHEEHLLGSDRPVVAQRYPMKWYKCTAYFGYWMGALSNLGYGLSYITGTYYSTFQDTSDAIVYMMHGENLRIADILFGIGMIICAILCVCTAIKLILFKKEAPKWVNYLLLWVMIIEVSYNIAVANIIGESMTMQIMISLVVSGLSILLHTVYYSRRDSLFIN